MFGSFTNKLRQFAINKMKEKNNENTEDFIKELIKEINNILLQEDVHSNLVTILADEIKKYLLENKQEIYNNNNLIKNLLKNILSKYILEDQNFIYKKNIIFVGDNGNGKTTALSKLACIFHNQNKKINVVHKDIFRYGSYEQLLENLDNTGINISKEIDNNYDYNFIDIAGFTSWDDHYYNSIKNIPDSTYIYVGSSLIGNQSFYTIEAIMKKINIDGIIITNCDAEARTGLFLSASYLIKKPILFISENEHIKSTDLQSSLIAFNKDSLLTRLVGLYDATGFQKEVDKVSRKKGNLLNKLMDGVFDYETLEEIIGGMVKGDFSGIMGSLGNMNVQNPQQTIMMKTLLLVIQSMTFKEKKNMELLEGPNSLSRIERIAKGTQKNPQEIMALIMTAKNMINTFKRFSHSGLNDLNLNNLENINLDELQEKISNPEFLKKYINDDNKTQNNFNLDKNYNTINLSMNKDNENNGQEIIHENNQEQNNGAANMFGNNEAMLKMIKQMYTPEQFKALLDQMASSPALFNMPGMPKIDPNLLKQITIEDIKNLFNTIG